MKALAARLQAKETVFGVREIVARSYGEQTTRGTEISVIKPRLRSPANPGDTFVGMNETTGDRSLGS